MSLDTKHPLYSEREPEWRQMRDTYAGERTVKERATMYLPATSGMLADGFPTALSNNASTQTKGYQDYLAYRMRARFPDLVDEAVSALLGVMHSKPPTISLPAKMEYLLKRASSRGESLEMLLKRINFEQMVVGRIGLLADIVDKGPLAGQFYIAAYDAEDVVNWDAAKSTELEVESLNLVVLDESDEQREPGGFSWAKKRRHRVLVLGSLERNEPEGEAVYSAGVFEEDQEFSESLLTTPVFQGKTLNAIPFVFVNAEDTAPEPDKPPLLGLSNLTLTIYRGEADYRQSLFMQGQDTFVQTGVPSNANVDGGDAPVRLGVGAVVSIADSAGDAKFVGVDSKGLPEQRQALANDYGRGEQFAGRLMDSATRERESGDALRIRLATRTATLNQVAQAGAYGLQRILRLIATWMGEDPEKVTVVPNLDFVDDQMTGEQLRALMEAKEKGAPVSLKTIHDVMSIRSMTAMTFDAEIAQIKAEKAVLEEIRPPVPETSAAAGGGGGASQPSGSSANPN